MRVTLEQVETLRKRIPCDYQQAERALRKTKGNTDAAILYLKKLENKKYKKILMIVQEMIQKLLNYQMLIYKQEKRVFKFPIVLVVLIVWSLGMPLPVLLALGVLAALSDFSFEIFDMNQDNGKEEFHSSSKNTKEQVKEQFAEEDDQEENKDQSTSTSIYEEDSKIVYQERQNEINEIEEEDGFDEIIIE